MSCPGNKQWYTCSKDDFKGCCSSDPCTKGECPDNDTPSNSSGGSKSSDNGSIDGSGGETSTTTSSTSFSTSWSLNSIDIDPGTPIQSQLTSNWGNGPLDGRTMTNHPTPSTLSTIPSPTTTTTSLPTTSTSSSTVTSTMTITTSTPQPDTAPPHQNTPNSTNTTAGAVAGSIVGLALFLGLGLMFYCWRILPKNKEDQERKNRRREERDRAKATARSAGRGKGNGFALVRWYGPQYSREQLWTDDGSGSSRNGCCGTGDCACGGGDKNGVRVVNGTGPHQFLNDNTYNRPQPPQQQPPQYRFPPHPAVTPPLPASTRSGQQPIFPPHPAIRTPPLQSRGTNPSLKSQPYKRLQYIPHPDQPFVSSPVGHGPGPESGMPSVALTAISPPQSQPTPPQATAAPPTVAAAAAAASVEPAKGHIIRPKTAELGDTGFYRQRAELAAYSQRELINMPVERRQSPLQQPQSHRQQLDPAQREMQEPTSPESPGRTKIVTPDGAILGANFERMPGCCEYATAFMGVYHVDGQGSRAEAAAHMKMRDDGVKDVDDEGKGLGIELNPGDDRDRKKDGNARKASN